MKVLLLGSKISFDKGGGPGMNTFFTELVPRLAKKASITTLPHKNSILVNNMYINRFINSKTFDVIHDLEGISNVRINKLNERKLITHIHDIDVLLLNKEVLFKKPNISNSVWFYLNKRNLMRKMENSKAIISVSNQIKELLIDFCEIEKQKVFVVHHGVSKNFKPLNINHKKFIIGTLSTMSPRKNPIMLLNAFKIFNGMLNRKESKETELYLYGNADNYTKKLLKNSASKYKNIKIGGVLNHDRKVMFYNSLDIFSFPSIEEGFGMPILEAQACGIPTVINGNGMFSEEIVKKCIKAYTEDNMADIFYKIFSRGITKTEKISYIKYAKSFTWEKAAEQTLKVYKQIAVE